MTNLKDYLLLYAKGVAMGAADIVPGVSGGSIAFITGIYTRLLDSIKSVDRQALALLFRGRIADFWAHIDGTFFLVLVLGIMTSIFSMSKLITHLMDEHPIPLWSFFCGLILISAVLVLKDIQSWSLGTVIALLIGTAGAYWITDLPPTGTPETWWFTIVAGAIAICAMILPGISGSFVLLILGQYERILAAVNEKDFLLLALFAMGCAIGILSFARVVSWLLHKFPSMTVALLAGFMLGSINKLWPWKEVLSSRVNSKGEEVPFLTENVMPSSFLETTGQDPLVVGAVLAFAFGILLVFGIERTAEFLKRR
jgi:putative membrane protein